MPKHSNSEMPNKERPGSRLPANENLKDKHLVDATELPPKEHPENEEEGREEIRNKALRDMMIEIDGAPEGAVIFIGGIVSPHAWSEDRSGTHRRASAQGYDKDFQEGLQKEGVFFVSHQTIRGATGGFANALVALESAIKAHSNDKIVIDSNFLLQEFLYKPWKAEDAEAFDPLSFGKQNKSMLQKWLQDEEKGEVHSDPKSLILQERFQSAFEGLAAFFNKYLHGRQAILGVTEDNQLATAFFAWAAKASLEPNAINDAMSKFHGSNKAVGFIRMQGRRIATKSDRRKFRTRRI